MSEIPAEPDDVLLSTPGPDARGVDQERAAAAVRELLLAVGEDPDRPGLRDTPARVARAYAETFAGLGQDPRDVLATTFDEDHDELVLVKDIPMYSDRKSTRLNSSHANISYAVFCLKKKKHNSRHQSSVTT